MAINVDLVEPPFEWARDFYESQQKKKANHRQVIVSFEDEAGVQEFAGLIGQSISKKTKELWFPPRKENLFDDLFEMDKSSVVNKSASGTRESKKAKKSNSSLFDHEPDFYAKHWRNMPEFDQPDNAAYRQITINLEFDDDVKAFFDKIEQTFTDKTKSVWFPDREKNNVRDLYWIDEEHITNE
jgi:hypothetical protein